MLEEVLKIVEETPVLGVKTKLKLISYLKENHLTDEQLSGILKSFQEANAKYEELMKDKEPERKKDLEAYQVELERIAHEVLPKKLHEEEEIEKKEDEKEEEELLKQL
jgi:hypothetical protein